MVDERTLERIAGYAQRVLPQWQGRACRNRLRFNHDGLQVEVEVPAAWRPGDDLTLAVEVRRQDEHGKRVHTWVWDETRNPGFVTNDEARLPDQDFALTVQLLDEVSSALRLLK